MEPNEIPTTPEAIVAKTKEMRSNAIELHRYGKETMSITDAELLVACTLIINAIIGKAKNPFMAKITRHATVLMIQHGKGETL